MNNTIIWEEKNLIEPTTKFENSGINVLNVITKETKKEFSKNACEGIGKVSGIYKIINKINGKYYVGSSNNIRRRWVLHRTLLNYNKHENDHLQKSWNKYGKDNFEFVIVEDNVAEQDLLIVEQNYIDICNKNPNTSYNLTLYSTAPMRGKKASEETKMKMSESHKNYTFTEEHKQNLSKSKTGANHHFYGKRPPNFGKKMSEEQKEKLRKAKLGKPSNMKGKKHTKESKLKMSISAKNRLGRMFVLQPQINLP